MKFNIPKRKAIYELLKDISLEVKSWRPRNSVFHNYAIKKFPSYYNVKQKYYNGGLVLDIKAGTRFRFIKNNNEEYFIDFSRQINKDRPYDHALLHIKLTDKEFQELEVELVND